jgi:hypothetical protein
MCMQSMSMKLFNRANNIKKIHRGYARPQPSGPTFTQEQLDNYQRRWNWPPPNVWPPPHDTPERENYRRKVYRLEKVKGKGLWPRVKSWFWYYNICSVDEELVLRGIYGYQEDGTVRLGPVWCCECLCGGCRLGCLGNGCINRPPNGRRGLHYCPGPEYSNPPKVGVTIKHNSRSKPLTHDPRP